MVCRVCKTDKPETDYYHKDRKKQHLSTECKRCQLNHQREKTFGVSSAEYWVMYHTQDGRCGICRKRLRSDRYKAFCVDHCHSTGKIRGLLCTNCNTAVGLLKDDPELMSQAARWVKV